MAKRVRSAPFSIQVSVTRSNGPPETFEIDGGCGSVRGQIHRALPPVPPAERESSSAFPMTRAWNPRKYNHCEPFETRQRYRASRAGPGQRRISYPSAEPSERDLPCGWKHAAGTPRGGASGATDGFTSGGKSGRGMIGLANRDDQYRMGFRASALVIRTPQRHGSGKTRCT